MDIAELKKIIEENDTAFGSKSALKLLKGNKISTIILSNDCDPGLLDKIRKISQKISVIQLDRSKEELSEACKKPFKISVVSIVAEKKTKEKSKEKGKKSR